MLFTCDQFSLDFPLYDFSKLTFWESCYILAACNVFFYVLFSDVIHENIQRRNGLCLLRFLVAVLEQNYSFVIDK